MKKNHLILIGYRGVGKSTIAEIISQSTNLKVISIDTEIEKKLGTSILNYINAGNSWESFRSLEAQVLMECVNLSNNILDCGGGIVEKVQNIEILKKSGQVFWLTASIPTIIERMNSSGERPNLCENKTLGQEVESILNQRTPLYKKASHVEISTEGSKIFDAPKQIMTIYQSN